MIRSGLRTLIAAFLMAPFFILFWKLRTWELPPVIETVHAIKFTVYQAFLSAAFSLLFGIAGAGDA